MLNVTNPLIFDPSIINIYSRKNKHITRNKNNLMMIVSITTKKQNNSNLFIPVASIESIYSCESKRINTKNNNNNETGHPYASMPLGANTSKKSAKL